MVCLKRKSEKSPKSRFSETTSAFVWNANLGFLRIAFQTNHVCLKRKLSETRPYLKKEQVKVILVGQDCKISCCTPTRIDILAPKKINRSPSGKELPITGNWLIREMHIPVRKVIPCKEGCRFEPTYPSAEEECFLSKYLLVLDYLTWEFASARCLLICLSCVHR